MSNLVAVAYPDEATAREVAQTLMELQKEHSIELEDLAAIGGATGAAAGAATDVGVDDNFMKDLGAKLQPGGAAVFVLVRQSTPDKVLPRISQYGGDVIHSSLSHDAEETLRPQTTA